MEILGRGSVCYKPYGKTYIFAELYDYLRRKGCIGYCELLPDGSQSKWKAVLKEKYHMSYPQPIEHNGDVYLIPESSFGKVLCAYKAVSFPDKWEKAYVLASGIGLTDTTFVSDSDRVYAFACSAEDPTDEILRMFELSDNGQLEETAMSPVVDDVSCARPAGKFSILTTSFTDRLRIARIVMAISSIFLR